MPWPSSPNGAPWVIAVNATSIPMAQARTTTPTGTRCARLPSRRPNAAVKTKPASGSSAISGIRTSKLIGRPSLAHRVVLVDERRAAVAEDRDDDREADGRLGRRDGHDHESDHRAVDREALHERTERDDRKVHRVQHDLDRHQHADRVAPGEEPEHADREEQRRDDEVGVEGVRAAGEERHHPERPGEGHEQERPEEDPDHGSRSWSRSRLARKTPPTTAARRSTPTTSKGRTQSAKSVVARSSVAVVIRALTSPQSVATIERIVKIGRASCRERVEI